MLGYVSPLARTSSDALGTEVLASFAALSRLHSDGRGTAWSAGATEVAVRTQLPGTPAADADEPAHARILYLRLASRGSAVSRENLQPFTTGALAFVHNGLLAPREVGLSALTARERAALRGTTDSEVYFALVRRAIGARTDPRAVARETARAVHGVRRLYPTACLNAMMLVGTTLVVVHAPGEAPTPYSAFAAHGVDRPDLPPGHDERYNVLSTTLLPSGTRVVATTGIDQRGWEPLPRDVVSVFSPGGTVRRAHV